MRGEESICSMLGQTRCLLPIVQSEPQEQPSAWPHVAARRRQ